jgi:hypothetical protein
MIGIWDSSPFAFGATESTTLALLGDGSGWTAVTPTGPPAGGEPAAEVAEVAESAAKEAAADVRSRVRKLTWDCPKAEVLEIRYDDYEFVRAQYSVQADGLRLSQHLDSARQFALASHQVTHDDLPTAATASTAP